MESVCFGGFLRWKKDESGKHGISFGLFMKQQFISGEEICFVGGGWNLSRVGDVREGEMRLCFEKKVCW